MVAKTLSRALALSLLVAPVAFGLGLGDIRLLSSLNAPLDAEIELVSAAPDELKGLKAQIASRETFARYKLDWPAFMGSVTVQAMHTADGRDIIKLRSTESVIEPFVTLLVEVNWARGKLIREYTMLLDPPVYTPGQSSADNAAITAAVTGQSDRQGSISRSTEPEQSASAPPGQPNESTDASATRAPESPSPTAAESTRLVHRGDTLSRIASEVAGAEPQATRRWMLAIYQANPRAFDGNMNILRSGAELAIPDSSAAEAISGRDASTQIRQQYAAWRETAPASSPEGAASEPGRLRLVPPSAESGAGAGGTATAAPGSDSNALQGRVRELEGQLQESRRLIELRNAELAQLQAQLAAKQSATAPAEAGSETAVEPPVATTTESPPSTEEAPPTAETAPTEETPTAEPAPAPEVQKSPAATAPSVSSPVQVQGSLLDTLKEYWWAVAALLVAILALLALRVWRSRQQSEFDDSLGRLATAGAPSMGRDFGRETAPIRTMESEPAFLVEETGTHQRPRFEEGAAVPRNVATDDTISSDTAVNLDQGDPLAEADFHMAYGLYDQAADLVRIAIAREPERRDLKLKLLEVYFVWGNKEQFLQAARELAGTRVQAAPGEWEKIVIMGKQLAPEDELFASGSGSGAAAGGVDLDLEGGEGGVDFDVLGEAAAGASEGVDLDIGSALGDNTVESPTRTTDAHLALHEQDLSGDATTRQMTQRVRSDDTTEAPTIEQPGISRLDNPTIRQKVNMALRQSGVEQTAELNIDDLGLDLSSLDTVDQPGLGASPDAATLVAGFDEHSRRVMAEAGRDMLADEEPTMPPIRVHVSQSDVSATTQMAAIKEHDLDFDFDARDGSNGVDVEFDVGTATASDGSYSATQRISAEDLALPDLEPVTMSEVGTKLDLARAYMDMGDPEGARNILDEVLHEGSVTQKQEAQRLLESLPG